MTPAYNMAQLEADLPFCFNQPSVCIAEYGLERTMKIGLIIVTLAINPINLLESIVGTKRNTRFYIVNHGQDDKIRYYLENFCAIHDGVFIHIGENRGLARSWNEAIKYSIDDGCDISILLNDDLLFVDDGFEKFCKFIEHTPSFDLAMLYGLETGESSYAGAMHYQGFACVALSQKCIDKVGYLDEFFAPAYFEDMDYLHRAKLLNAQIIVSSECLVHHERSSTGRSDPQLLEHLNVRYAVNAAYYRQKWGGDPDSETFPHPFNNENNSATITWSDRTAPYTIGANSMDNELPPHLAAHSDIHYTTFLQRLCEKRNTQTYLEVGVSTGELFSRMKCDHGVAVDPSFALTTNIANNKTRVSVFQMTSDRFFKSEATKIFKDAAPDLVFLDGMHTFEYLLRDFYNAEALCDRSSLIILHDCIPLNAEMTIRSLDESVRKGQGTPYSNYWTGDVWKIIPILSEYRPDLKMIFVPCPPSGLVCISNLDPHSTILQDAYFEVLQKYRPLKSDFKAVQELHEAIALTGTNVILHEYDSSLYFKM